MYLPTERQETERTVKIKEMFSYNPESIFGKSQHLKTTHLRINVAAERFDLH